MAEASAPAARVLFVCVGNAGRSQMAEGFARALSGGRVQAHSAGSRPAGFVLPQAIRLMAEKGIDISGQRSKGLAELPPETAWDYIVTMGCGDACPFLPARHRLDWDLPDPALLPEGAFRALRDRIEGLVSELVREAIRPDPPHPPR